jgi:hypothetical protein
MRGQIIVIPGGPFVLAMLATMAVLRLAFKIALWRSVLFSFFCWVVLWFLVTNLVAYFSGRPVMSPIARLW